MRDLSVVSQKPAMSKGVQGWRGGATSKAFGLAINRSRVQILLEVTLRNNLGQVVHTIAKQYNLVPAKRR